MSPALDVAADQWQLRQVMKRRKRQILAAVVRTYFTAHQPSSLRNAALRSFIFDETHLMPTVANLVIATTSNQQQQQQQQNEEDEEDQVEEFSIDEATTTMVNQPPPTSPRRCWTWRRMKETQFDQFLNENNDDQLWRSTLGMSRAAFLAFCGVMREALQKLETRYGTTIALEKRVAIALRKLASGDSYTVTGNFFGVPKSTVHRTTRELVTALVANKARWLGELTADCSSLVDGFQRVTNVPNVAGVVGSFNVELINQANHQTSLNCQLVCDHALRLLDVVVGRPLADSDLFRRAEANEVLAKPLVQSANCQLRPVLVASSTEYPLRSWLLTPFELATTPGKRALNASLAKLSGDVVCRTMALLTRRWQILTKKLENAPDYVGETFMACCVLHNFLVEQNDFDTSETALPVKEEEQEQQETDNKLANARSTSNNKLDASNNEQLRSASPEQMRNAIAETLCS